MRAQHDEQRKVMPGWSVSVILGGLLVAAFFGSLMLGRYPVSPKVFFEVIFGNAADHETAAMALFNIRLPRICLACVTGCALSAAGAVYQNVFRNPMASPDLLGASGGAGFGASLSILLGASGAMVTAASFAAGLLTVFLVLLTAKHAKGEKTLTIILSGILFGSLVSSGTSFVKLIADTDDKLPKITYWLMGSLSGASMKDVVFEVIPVVIGLVPMLLLRYRLNILTLGDEEAKALGTDPKLIRFVSVICATLMTAAAVSVSGMIGWVGLVTPHIFRKVTGNDMRLLLPTCMAGGALFLLVTDDISRYLFVTEIPIGILTAVIGAPFFIWLIIFRDNR